MTYLFIDTNIFLHFKFFIEVPWTKIIADEFRIVVAPVVLDEIDKHKRHTNPKISGRAKKVLTKIEEIASQKLDYPLECLLKRPKSNTFESNGLDRGEQDDSILASILEFKVDHDNERIIFISNDTGPRLRSRSLSIEAIGLSDEYLLAEEKSEEQKLLEKLKAENSALKNKIPKVSLMFKDEKVVFDWELKKEDEDFESFLSKSMEKEMKKLPYLVYEEPEPGPKLSDEERTMTLREVLGRPDLNPFGNMSMSEEQVKKYNGSLDGYFGDYKMYLYKKFENDRIRMLSMPIDLDLHNKGNTPALDIDIWLHFPDGFELFSLDKFPKKPKKPNEPYRPKHKWDFGPIFAPGLGTLGGIYAQSKMPDINFNSPDIRKTNSYEVEINYKSLKHFQHHKLDSLVVVYDSFEEASGFTIDYKLMVSNVPEPVIGQLHVKLTKVT